MKLFFVMALCFFMTALYPQNAYAYIDPGTGSLILQALAAGAFTLLAFWRGLREKIASFFKSKKSNEDN